MDVARLATLFGYFRNVAVSGIPPCQGGCPPPALSGSGFQYTPCDCLWRGGRSSVHHHRLNMHMVRRTSNNGAARPVVIANQ